MAFIKCISLINKRGDPSVVEKTLPQEDGRECEIPSSLSDMLLRVTRVVSGDPYEVKYVPSG